MMASPASPPVEGGPLCLVTGITGFVGGFVVKALLAKGYRVRGTVRDLAAQQRFAHLTDPVAGGDRLEVVQATLEDDQEAWQKHIAGCTYVLHVAALVAGGEGNPDAFISAEVEGTLLVLRAASQVRSVERVVVTSSVAAIALGHDELKASGHVFTETDYSVPIENPSGIFIYSKAKTLAEAAAWEYVRGQQRTNPDHYDMVTMNPATCVGAILTPEVRSSTKLIYAIFMNLLPGLLNMSYNLVHIQDVADAHVLALEKPQAGGERYLLCGGQRHAREVARVLQQEFEPQGFYINTSVLSSLRAWYLSSRHPIVQTMLVGLPTMYDGSKAERDLGLEYRDVDEGIVECAQSFVDQRVAYAKPRPQDNTWKWVGVSAAVILGVVVAQRRGWISLPFVSRR